MRAMFPPTRDGKGGYYAVLFVQSKPELSFTKTDGQGVFTNMRLGCLVLLAAEKTEDLKIELSNVTFTPPSSTHGLSLVFDLHNAGNTHLLPIARLSVLNSPKNLVAKAQSLEKRFLPEQQDSMQSSSDTTLT